MPHGDSVAKAFNKINSLTGNLEGGTMLSTAHFTLIVAEDAIIAYGFYDVGHGEVGLTNHDQCYATICSTANKQWMGELAPPGSGEAQKPFSRFVLAAPHDNGMNSMMNLDVVLSAVDTSMLPELRNISPQQHCFNHVSDDVSVLMLPKIFYGVSITQKKEIPIMLALGARCFEFRPAELLPMFQRVSSLLNK